jgi:hypothetical protein
MVTRGLLAARGTCRIAGADVGSGLDRGGGARVEKSLWYFAWSRTLIAALTQSVQRPSQRSPVAMPTQSVSTVHDWL